MRCMPCRPPTLHAQRNGTGAASGSGMPQMHRRWKAWNEDVAVEWMPDRRHAGRRPAEPRRSALRGALHALRADIAAWSIRDPHGRRLIAVASRDRAWSAWRTLVCQLPVELLVRADGVALRQPLILPDDAADHPFAALLRRATVHVMHIPLRGDVREMIHVVRFAALRFGVRERTLARVIAARVPAVSASVPQIAG
jgi:hypothetical protein